MPSTRSNRFNTLLCATSLMSFVGTATALEYPIGEPQLRHGMEIAAVYLQPVVMEPVMGLSHQQADVHIEADIKALEDNPNGLVAGGWVPYLEIEFALNKQGSDTTISGSFHPMVASDGPHYGANVKLLGPGKYHLRYTIKPPVTHGMPFMRHIDRETGVAEWFKPFDVEYDFVYAGVGKKGGY
ncbi:MAG: iron transporter [Hahellaceae bacterium]|nr:iron transporter [Hahellaceae bacterium]MCP5169234.1 iron transporter [Hahellaceae bacterium]